MKKMRLFAGRNWMAAGVLGAALVFGAGLVQAEEGNAGAAVQSSAAVQGDVTAVDAAGAETIALEDAGVTADAAERLRTETDREDGEIVYEVSFMVDGVEYDYQIREADGEILEWELDGKDVGAAVAEERLKSDQEMEAESQNDKAPSEDASTLIGLEQAKTLALEDAGMNAADVSFSKIKYEKDSRRVIYEVEFYQGRQEYEYEIDAYSGAILKAERD